MNEIEIKAKITDFDDIKKKLIDLGCNLSKPLTQKDKIYLPKSIDYPDITTGSVILRIRDSNNIYTMTLKKHLANELSCVEKEIVIDNPKEGDEMLRLMGYYEAIQVSKKRIKCKYKDINICLDHVENLGSFIELEKLTYDENLSEIQEELAEFLKNLDIEKEDLVLKGYDTLLYELNNQ